MRLQKLNFNYIYNGLLWWYLRYFIRKNRVHFASIRVYLRAKNYAHAISVPTPVYTLNRTCHSRLTPVDNLIFGLDFCGKATPYNTTTICLRSNDAPPSLIISLHRGFTYFGRHTDFTLKSAGVESFSACSSLPTYALGGTVIVCETSKPILTRLAILSPPAFATNHFGRR